MKITIPQARILTLLLPVYFNDPSSEWPLLTRSAIQQRIGSTPKSGLVTTAIVGRGHRGGKGGNVTGLLPMSFVEAICVNVEGMKEINYRITRDGISAIKQFITDGGKLSSVKDAAKHRNKRYVKEV